MRGTGFRIFGLALLLVAPAAPAQDGPGRRAAVYDYLAAHLPRYRALAAKPWPGPLPVTRKLSPGDEYAGADALAAILTDLGDLSPDATSPAMTYDGPVVEATRRFQGRHGLTPDGVVGAATLGALNVPHATRLAQLEDSLGWLATITVPTGESLVVVNTPAFQLYAWLAEDLGRPATLTMPVVVGKAATSRTPILAGAFSHLVFAPYWYVPRSIVLKEMLPAYSC